MKLEYPELQSPFDQLREVDSEGKTQVQVVFDTNTFWLSQQRMAELFGVTQQDISHHLQQIDQSGEIHLSDGYKKYLYASEQ